MGTELDHLILHVNDRAKSLEFYCKILGFEREADDGPFSPVRVSPGCLLLLAEWGTKGGEHLAFSMSKEEFTSVFARIKAQSVTYGDEFDKVGNMKGPGRERGARGMAETIYFFDPDKHLLEIRHYD